MSVQEVSILIEHSNRAAWSPNNILYECSNKGSYGDPGGGAIEDSARTVIMNQKRRMCLVFCRSLEELMAEFSCDTIDALWETVSAVLNWRYPLVRMFNCWSSRRSIYHGKRSIGGLDVDIYSLLEAKQPGEQGFSRKTSAKEVRIKWNPRLRLTL